MYDRLIHSDWSIESKKRWMATAERTTQGWQVTAPQPVPPAVEFIDRWLFNGWTVLAGFDFPIGLPTAFGKKTGFANFTSALPEFGSGDWARFFDIADSPSDISPRRPFYPRSARAGSKQSHLLDALEVKAMDDIRRVCERKTDERRPACSLFWTLGGNQVGKAAIDGWQSVVRPARLRGARLWPFDGRLNELSKLPGCVICETYPQEAYGHTGIRFRTGGSKRVQEDRRSASANLFTWAEKHSVSFTTDARDVLLNGFGPSASGEDPFDAFVGLLGMIEVVDGRRPEGGASAGNSALWEGWILGQQKPQML